MFRLVLDNLDGRLRGIKRDQREAIKIHRAATVPADGSQLEPGVVRADQAMMASPSSIKSTTDPQIISRVRCE